MIRGKLLANDSHVTGLAPATSYRAAAVLDPAKPGRSRAQGSGAVARLVSIRAMGSSGVGLGGRFGEANSRHGGAEDSGEWQDEEGSARELGGVRIQAREAFGSRFLPDRSGGGLADLALQASMGRGHGVVLLRGKIERSET